MNEDVREFLGVGRHDFWYYPGLVMAIGSFWVSGVLPVAVLLAASTVLVGVFLVKSTRRYLHSRELRTATRAFGLVGNVVVAVLQIGIVAVRISRLVP